MKTKTVAFTGHRPRHKSFKLTLEEEKQICQSYKQGLSIRTIAKYSKVGRTAIGRILLENNIQRKGIGNSYNIRKYTLNEEFFKVIDTEEKAYWLGFIAADGHVADEGIVLTLAEKDKDHILKFLSAVDSNKGVTYNVNTKSYTGAIYSKRMVDDLRNLGLYRDKSYNLQLPLLKDEFMPHLIRGLFDGDGCITKGVISFSGTIHVVQRIKDILLTKFNVHDCKIQRLGEVFATASWYKNRHLILNYMYGESSTYLQRKFTLYKNYIEEYEQKYS